MRVERRLLIILAGLSLLTACSVHVDKSTDRAEKDVDIKTPFGSISVHKGETSAKETGLPVYPGARPSQDVMNKDNNANVDISSSLFGLKVAVAELESDDPPEKILSFYHKEMGKFGSVIECSAGGVNLAFHRRTKDEPVSCENQHMGRRFDKELKVGTENDQHIVAIRNQGKGTQFAVIYVRAWDDQDTL